MKRKKKGTLWESLKKCVRKNLKFGSFYNGGNLIQFTLAEVLIAEEEQELFSLSGVQRLVVKMMQLHVLHQLAK